MNSNPELIELKCYPKINIGLKVHAPTITGYHPLKSLFFYAVGELHDSIRIESADHTSICVPGYQISQTENLVYKAHLKLKNLGVLSDFQKINIEKKIPLGAGLGGGSSNAGNYLKYFGKQLSDLTEIASQLGADVPFFTQNEACLVTGFGERLQILRHNLKIPALIITNDEHCCTAKIFNVFDSSKIKQWNFDPDRILQMLHTADSALQDLIQNDLELSAIQTYPRLDDIYKELRKELFNDSFFSGMSGSGSSFFALFDSNHKRDSSYKTLTSLGFKAYQTEIRSNIGDI